MKKDLVDGLVEREIGLVLLDLKDENDIIFFQPKAKRKGREKLEKETV